VWVQVSSSLDLPPPRPSVKITGQGSPGGLGRYHSGGGSPGGGGGAQVTPGAGVEQQLLLVGSGRMLEPQELSCEPRGERGFGEGSGWDAAHGRPRHLTFYHP
jgi:hypothetical protein